MTIDQDVVEEYQNKISKVVTKDTLHEGLEGGR